MSLLIGVTICLVFSAFFSGSEMAFLSTDRVKLRNEAESGNPRAASLFELFSDSRRFVTSVLIGNNLVNVAATALLTAFLNSRFGLESEWLVTALLGPILIIFGETVTKAYGRYRRREFLMDHLNLTLFVSKLFYWPARILLLASDFLLGEKGKNARKNLLVSEDEFRFLIEESVRSGVLEEHEQRLVERILDFERIPVERVMQRLTLIPGVELGATVGDAKNEARLTGSKIVLVYEEIPSIVIGTVYVFDLLFESDEKKGLREYLRAPIFLPHETSLEKAFLTLQQRRQSFALVTDARLEVTGVVDIESLLAI